MLQENGNCHLARCAACECIPRLYYFTYDRQHSINTEKICTLEFLGNGIHRLDIVVQSTLCTIPIHFAIHKFKSI